MKYIILLVAGCLAILCPSSCTKYLDAKPNQKLAIPSSIEDLESLVHNSSFINLGTTVADFGTDEYYIALNTWNTMRAVEKTSYIWADSGMLNTDWNNLYRGIFYTNTVLEYADKIASNGKEDVIASIKAAALLLRAQLFYQSAQVFAPAYQSSTASTMAGIPLRTDDNFNTPSTRPSVQQVYDQIIHDIQNALPDLPALPATKSNPSKVAGFALLSRTYLVMGNYEQSLLYADSCLAIQHELIDYNTLNSTAAFPIASYNKEVILQVTGSYNGIVNVAANMDTGLVSSYAPDDLRRNIYYNTRTNATIAFKGNYNGSYFDNFQGLAVDELYLTKAECLARKGSVAPAMQTLNDLLVTRYAQGHFTPLTANSPQEALNIILSERKKELVFRGLRWTDLRRLAQENKTPVITRILNGQHYDLAPDDLRYTWLIPRLVIQLSGMSQNDR